MSPWRPNPYNEGCRVCGVIFQGDMGMSVRGGHHVHHACAHLDDLVEKLVTARRATGAALLAGGSVLMMVQHVIDSAKFDDSSDRVKRAVAELESALFRGEVSIATAAAHHVAGGGE